jgi:hypothetical protein
LTRFAFLNQNQPHRLSTGKREMPPVLEKLVKKIEKQGKPKSNAFAIATSALQKQGKMVKGSQKLTAKGAAYQRRSGRGR